MRSVPYYDKLAAAPYDGDPSLVEVERIIYCVDLGELDDAHRKLLDEIYRELPGRYRELQIPTWFGDREPEPPFLSASAEPPGIQVYGILPEADCAAWDAGFIAALSASALPFRELP